jgi:2-oxo-hept-3-ene-1,7-dioate hydratase
MVASTIPIVTGSAGITLDRNAVRAAALALDEAERTQRQIRLLSETYPGITMDDAYAIQAEWMRIKQGAGDGVIGWKIGLTSKAMQQALSIDIPDSGVLLQSMDFANGSTVAAGRFIQPRIEAEIAFITKAPLDDPAPEAILAATDYIAPALEILDTRITRKDPQTGRLRTVYDTISDNAANGGIVMGEPVRDFQGMDLRWIGAICSRNDEIEETGLGAGVLGDPLLSMSWLVQRLSAYGQRIEAGQVVLSGSFIRPIEAPSGSHIVGDFGNLGKVEITFG